VASQFSFTVSFMSCGETWKIHIFSSMTEQETCIPESELDFALLALNSTHKLNN